MSHTLFICGKGGVGKTSIASAMALAFSREFKTLCITIDQPHSLGLHLNSVISNQISQVANNLHAVHLDRQECFILLIQSLLKIRALSDWIIAHPFFPFISAVIPGIREYAIIDQIRKHAQESDSEPFSKIIVDTPAAGHALDFLSVSKSFRKLLAFSPIRFQFSRTEEFLENSRKISVLLVTTPTEIAIQETIFFADRLGKKTEISPSALYINKYDMPLSTGLSNFLNDNSEQTDRTCKNSRQLLNLSFGEKGSEDLISALEFQNFLAKSSSEAKKKLSVALKCPLIPIPYFLHRNAQNLTQSISHHLSKAAADE